MFNKREDSQMFLSRLVGKSYRIIKSLNAKHLAELGFHDFKVGHVMVMMNLKEEGTTAAEIAKKVRVSKQAMSKLVLELIEKGFLKSFKHPTDQRAALIQLTAEGSHFLAALHECRVRVDEEIAQVIGVDKLAQLHTILGDLMSHFETDMLMDLENDALASAKLN
ncbi:MAG: winged helix DNA-binding protein [Cytophagaceae bacterium]|nr:winged helix DNA-binding protein [Cytophagaceae bacterium]MBP6094334.1 winged helix DNA-binding protein [Cytophagaceae bacterium]